MSTRKCDCDEVLHGCYHKPGCAIYAGPPPDKPAPVVTASTGADRWSDEVVEAAKEAVDAVLSAEVSCTCLDAYKRMSKPDPSCSYHAIAWGGGVDMLARAALGVVPPDPVVAAIREVMAGRVAPLADPDGWSTSDERRLNAIARLLADGAGT